MTCRDGNSPRVALVSKWEQRHTMSRAVVAGQRGESPAFYLKILLNDGDHTREWSPRYAWMFATIYVNGREQTAKNKSRKHSTQSAIIDEAYPSRVGADRWVYSQSGEEIGNQSPANSLMRCSSSSLQIRS